MVERMVDPKDLFFQIVHVGKVESPEYRAQIRIIGEDDIHREWRLSLNQLLAWSFFMDRALECLDYDEILDRDIEITEVHLEDYQKWLCKKFSSQSRESP